MRSVMVPTRLVRGFQRGVYMEAFRDEEFVLVVLAGPLPGGWRLPVRRKGRRVRAGS